jgi:hypothetical protein
MHTPSAKVKSVTIESGASQMGPELQESDPQEVDPQDSELQEVFDHDDAFEGVRPPRSVRLLVAFSSSRALCVQSDPSSER